MPLQSRSNKHATYTGTCPYGDDPLIEDELDEIQLLRCDEEGDEDTEFFLDFKGELTGKLDGSFTAADIQEALEVS